MAQRSLPQAGDETATPAYVDAGPYTADEWAELFRLLFTTDQQATQGVLRGVWNELAPTNTATRTVNIATGAGIVNGHVLINDTATAIAVDAGAARNDALVMLENNSNAAIGAGAATNYNTVGNADIPPYTARLAVVKDDAANFSQTNTLWMTRLATFTTGAGALTNFTDVRAYCQFSGAGGPATRSFLVMGEQAYEFDLLTSVSTPLFSTFLGWSMTDGDDCFVRGRFIVPSDFVSDMTVQVVVTPGASGNIYGGVRYGYGACSEIDGTHSVPSTYSAVAVVYDTISCIYSTSLASAAVGDIVDCEFDRVGNSSQDTVNAAVWFKGWLVTYTPIS